MEKYLIVVEKSQTGYSAYSPDVLGCIATGKTLEKTIANMKSALTMHLKAMRKEGEEIPKPRGVQSYLDAQRDSANEDYLILHVPVESILPKRVAA
jgi:predicted RNase H-like HicB family nuclease